MKPVLTLLVTLLSVSAFADSFTVIRDGQEYLCSPRNSNPGGAIDCVNKAYAGPFTKDEATRLCSGATSVGPAECAIKAYAGPFNKAEAVELCSRNGTVANADCAIKAYAGPYNKAEAVQLCKVQPQLMMRSLDLLRQSPEIQEKVMQMKLAYPELQK